MNDKKIGKAIRTLRKANGMTLLELASVANTDPGNISRLERGLQGVSEGMLQNIADALGIQVSKLYEMVELPRPKAEEIARSYNKDLATLEKLYLALRGTKRKQALRILKALSEE